MDFSMFLFKGAINSEACYTKDCLIVHRLFGGDRYRSVRLLVTSKTRKSIELSRVFRPVRLGIITRGVLPDASYWISPIK